MPAALSAAGAGLAPGLHGKVPTKGDFVTRRLPRDFLDPWDQWLQSAINCSKEQLGEEWLPIYLTSPIWRFILSPGLCGGDAVAGVLMPSVDRVGRYFPFTLAVALSGCSNPAAVPVTGAKWFDRAEALALTALEDPFDFESFDGEVGASSGPSYPGNGVPSQIYPSLNGMRIGFDPSASVAAGFAPLVNQHLLGMFPQYSIWWNVGSEDTEPSLIICNGLPQIGGFAAFLDGRWQQWGWEGSDDPLQTAGSGLI